MSKDAYKKILQAAVELFAKKRFDEISVQEICNAAGISKNTFYYHLKSKEDIIGELYYDFNETSAEALGAALNEKNDWEKIWLVYKANFKYKNNAGIMSDILRINLLGDKGTYKLDDDRLMPFIVPLIESCQKDGIIRNRSNATDLYRTAAILLVGLNYWWCVKNGAFDYFNTARKNLETLYDISPEFCIAPEA